MTLEKEVGEFTAKKDVLAGFYKEYIFTGKEVEKAEEEAMNALCKIKDDGREQLFEEDLKTLFEENGRGNRFFELRGKCKK